MTHNTKLNAALVIAGVSLALSISTTMRGTMRGAVRGQGDAGGTTHACVDREARDQTDKLRKMVAERDALVTRLARAASAPTSAAPSGESAKPGTSPSQSSSTAAPAVREPRRYAHFEVGNPAVTVTQKDDGTYDIRTTDPKLSGTTLQITAVTPSGEEDTLFIRVP